MCNFLCHRGPCSSQMLHPVASPAGFHLLFPALSPPSLHLTGPFRRHLCRSLLHLWSSVTCATCKQGSVKQGNTLPPALVSGRLAGLWSGGGRAGRCFILPDGAVINEPNVMPLKTGRRSPPPFNIISTGPQHTHIQNRYAYGNRRVAEIEALT